MKRIASLLAAIAVLIGSSSASAQYYEIANQLPGLLSPALSGSFKYKGFVDISGTAGIGDNRANFLGVSTTQGFQYASWFFMGVGLGVDVAMAHQPEIYADAPSLDTDYGYGPHPYYDGKKTKAMIPVFSDFRFNIGDTSKTSFFIDLKIGAAWLIGNGDLAMENGYLSTSTQFYLKPTAGVRIPISGKQAVNIGVTYQLLTSNNNYCRWNDDSVTLNSLGATIAFEW